MDVMEAGDRAEALRRVRVEFPKGSSYRMAAAARQVAHYGTGPFEVVDHIHGDKGPKVVLKCPKKGSQFGLYPNQIVTN